MRPPEIVFSMAITAACASPSATALNSPSKVGHSTMEISSPLAE